MYHLLQKAVELGHDKALNYEKLFLNSAPCVSIELLNVVMELDIPVHISYDCEYLYWYNPYSCKGAKVRL